MTSCMTKQPARSSLTFTTKFLCLRNPTRAWLKHSNGYQGQWSAHAYLGVTLQCPRGWYRWTCVTWRQLTDAPLDSKHSSIPAEHHDEAFRDKLFWCLEFLSRGQDCTPVCEHATHKKHWDFHIMSSELRVFFSPVWVLLSPLVLCLHLLLWLPRAGKVLRTVEFCLLSRPVVQQPHFSKAAVMTQRVRSGSI